jgi:hypothetical protein
MKPIALLRMSQGTAASVTLRLPDGQPVGWSRVAARIWSMLNASLPPGDGSPDIRVESHRTSKASDLGVDEHAG